MLEDKTYQQMRNEFQKVFFAKLAPILPKYERERKFTLMCASFFSGILIAWSLYILYQGLMLISNIMDKVPCFIGAGFIIILSFVVWQIFKKAFEKKIKKEIMQKICQCCGQLDYTTNLKEPLNIAHLAPNFKRSITDDIFYGKYKNVNYAIIEVELHQRIRDIDICLFDGVIIKFDFNKSFKGNTVILPKAKLPVAPVSSLKLSAFEDVNFNKKYDVFTDDEVEARYLISPSFMEKLNNVKMSFHSDKISCSFYENHLLVGIHTKKDLFSLGSLVRPVNDEKQFFQMFEEILSIIQLIDHFKLDQKIGL